MAEKELMHDLYEKKDIRKNVEDRQKQIDNSKNDTYDDVEVYQAAQDMVKRYKLAYRLNLVVPGWDWKKYADQIIKSDVGNNLAQYKKLELDWRKKNPKAADRADRILTPFDNLRREIENDIKKLKELIDSKWFYRVWDIAPNLDRIASRINEKEKQLRPNAEKEISQQNTENLARTSSITMNQWKKKEATENLQPTEYMKRIWDKFVFTKESNPVQIHDVMSAFIKEKPDDVFLLDYNWCIWNDKLKADIKKRTGNNSMKVYIKYNPQIKTYDFYNTDWKLLEGKRPYIWEWVTMMTKNVEWIVLENKKQAAIEAATNIDYSKLSNDLEKNFSEQIAALKEIKLTKNISLYDELCHWKWWGESHPNLLRDFLVRTEARLDKVIKRRRANTRLDQKNPIDTWDWIFNANFVDSEKTSVPLFVKENGKWTASIPEYLYSYISWRTNQLKDYFTQRLLSKRNTLSHMEDREQVVEFESQTKGLNEENKKKLEAQIENKKELQLYWLDKLLEVTTELEKKKTNSESTAFAKHIESIRNDIIKSPKGAKVSEKTRKKALEEAQRLWLEYKHNDSSRATMDDETAKKRIEQIFKAESRSKIQEAAIELWNNMTLTDNSSRKWVVEDALNDWSEANQDYYESRRKKEEAWELIWDETPPMKINKEEYDKCFQKICQLSYINVNEETWEIWPQANIDFIDKLMACETTISLGHDEKGLDTILLDYWIITEEIANKDKHAYSEFKDKIFETIKNKREMESKFQVSKDDMRKKYNAEIEELKRKTSLNDEEMARMAILMWLIEDDDLLNDLAEKQTEMWKKTIKYCGMDDLLHEHITPYLAKNGGWINGTNAEYYNDSNWLRWRWDWTDESCEKIGPMLKDILIEVAITAVAIGLWTITGWAWTAAVMALRAGALWIRAANYANKARKLLKIAELCEKVWKCIAKNWKFLTKLKNWKFITKLKDSRLWRSYTRANHEITGWRIINRTEELEKWRNLFFKEGRTIWDLIKAWNIERTYGSAWMKAVWLIFEWTWFHVASTALHNAINGENILNGLNPIDNFKWYAQSVAFLWMLKFLWKPINTMTSTSMNFIMTQKFSASQLWKAIKYVAWIWGEFWSLFVTDEALNVAFEWELKEMTTEDAIHSIGMILWLRLHWYIKGKIKEIKIKKYDKNKKELTIDFWEWEMKISEKDIYDNYKKTPELKKLGSQYKWMEEQSKFNEEYNQAKEVIQRLPESLRTEAMKKFLEAWDMMDFSPHDIKTIQREIWLKWKEVDWVLGPKSLKTLREYVSKNGWTSETLNDQVVDKATKMLHEKFDQEMMSENWITIDWITYKIKREQYMWVNKEHNPRTLIYTEIWWKKPLEITIRVDNNSQIPTWSKWDYIRRRLELPRKKYVEKNLNSTLESARNELNWEFNRDIESRTRDLEWKRNDRAALELRKKNLSEEIDWLKSRKAKLEQQLQKISKELTIQPDISSLKDIYTIIKEWNKVSIEWKKLTFIGVKWDKIVFTKWKWKTREFSSFKELQDAKANFNFDIKDRQSGRWKEQQKQFEELVKKEARTKNANEIIREYEKLQRQKAQIEQDIRDWFFRENADRLVWKHIWIDGVEYQCTGKNTNDGKTTLNFKKTDWSDHFTISSFEQLKSKWQQIKGYKVLKTNLPNFQKETHELLRWENWNPNKPWLFNGWDKYVNQKRQALQQVDQQLQSGRANYDNAKLATTPKKVPNPEYDRIQKEIEWIDEKLIKKWEELTNLERDLWTSADEIAKIEKKIADLNAQKDNLSRTNETWDITGNEWNGWDVIENEIREEINNSEDVANKFNEIKTEAESANYDNIKLDWVTQKMFETWTYIEWVQRRFKNLSLKPNTKLSKNFLRKMGDKLVEMKNTWWEKLSEYHKKLVEKWNKFFEKKLKEEWNEVEIKEEEIDIIEKSSKTFWEYNQEFADIIRNNQNKIINLEKIEKIDSFMTESLEFLKKEMWIDDPNLKIKILEWTEWINNHYDRSTNTVYFSRNWWWKWQPYIKWWNKAEIFWGIWHELNHYLQEAEIIRHYWKGNADIDLYVESILEKANIEWLEMIEKYRSQIDVNEPISERAVKYAESYIKAAKDRTIFDENWNILDYNKYRNLLYEKESFNRWDMLVDEYKKATKSYKEQQRRQQEEQRRQQEQQRRQREEQERRQREEQEDQDADIQILYSGIQETELNMLRNLNKWKNEKAYLKEYWEPQNVVPLWNGIDLYVSNCLILWNRKFLVWYVKKWQELKLRLFYRSNSEWIRRSCPWERTDWAYSKGEDIENSSYETTTRIPNELQYKFDNLPQEYTHSNPITLDWVWYNILLPEMKSEINISKLFTNSPANSTVRYIMRHNTAEIKNMYRKLGSNVNLEWMKIGKWYTYEHHYLWTIQVEIWTLNINWKNINFYFAHAKNDPQNRVRIEEVKYADAKINSFWIYDKQINASPLTWKPIDYAQQVPIDMQQNQRIWWDYIDIRDLYQENPIIKRYKELSQLQSRAVA